MGGTELIPVRALGVTVGIETPESLVGAVRRAWSRALVDAEPDTTVACDGEEAVALHHLSSHVTVAAITRRAGELWMLHAAGLADLATGAAVALVAPSGTGKSTVSRALARRWGYLSDETVGVWPDRAVESYAKPLSLIEDEGGLKVQRSADELGLAVAPAQARLRAIVLLQRDGTAEPVLEPVRLAEALPLLAPETSYLGRFDRPLHHMAAILDGVEVHRVHYAEAATLEPIVSALLGAA